MNTNQTSLRHVDDSLTHAVASHSCTAGMINESNPVVKVGESLDFQDKLLEDLFDLIGNLESKIHHILVSDTPAQLNTNARSSNQLSPAVMHITQNNSKIIESIQTLRSIIERVS